MKKRLNKRRAEKREDFVDILVGYKNRKKQINQSFEKRKETMTLEDIAKKSGQLSKLRKAIKNQSQTVPNDTISEIIKKGLQIEDIKINVKPKPEQQNENKDK